MPIFSILHTFGRYLQTTALNLWHSSMFCRHLCNEFTDKDCQDCLDYLNLKHELIMENQTTPVEEVVFDLASVSVLITTHIRFHKPCFEGYKQFREFASLLKIEVQDVQSNNGWNEQTEEMITEQLDHVKSLITDKSPYHRDLFIAGMTYEQAHLYFIVESENFGEVTQRRSVENSCTEIKMIAKTLGVEMTPIESALSRLIENMETHDRSFVWKAVMLNVRHLLCQPPMPISYEKYRRGRTKQTHNNRILGSFVGSTAGKKCTTCFSRH